MGTSCLFSPFLAFCYFLVLLCSTMRLMCTEGRKAGLACRSRELVEFRAGPMRPWSSGIVGRDEEAVRE